ncbi:hypothetical protein [Yinghuangia sp. YIM S10712]
MSVVPALVRSLGSPRRLCDRLGLTVGGAEPYTGTLGRHNTTGPHIGSRI